jgi:hypothetical protein
MFPSTTKRVEDARPKLYRRAHLGSVAGIVAVALSFALLARMLTLPPSVHHLRIDNPSKFDLSIAVTSGDHDGWMSVGSARRNATTGFDDVLDQGDVWIFRFSAQARSAAEVRVTRGEMASAGWQLSIPPQVSDDLRAQGAEFPP